MRRALCALGIVCFCVSLVGCGDDTVNDATTTVAPGDAVKKAGEMPKPSVAGKSEKKK